MARYGVFGDTAIVPAYAASKYPDVLSPEEAASIWMQYVTAYGALIHHANLQKGQTALFTAATGGLGVAAIQMARQLGVRSIATTRSAAKRPLLESEARSHHSDRRRRPRRTRERDYRWAWRRLRLGRRWRQQVPKTRRGYGPVRADHHVRNARVRCGEQHADAVVFRLSPTVSPFAGTCSSSSPTGPRRFGDAKPYHPTAYDAAKRYVLEGVASGNLKPALAESFPLDQIVKAHQYVEENQKLGKVVVRVN
jgi:NADPH:quinone reductase-like Zn-dependent oxidoreductase